MKNCRNIHWRCRLVTTMTYQCQCSFSPSSEPGCRPVPMWLYNCHSMLMVYIYHDLHIPVFKYSTIYVTRTMTFDFSGWVPGAPVCCGHDHVQFSVASTKSRYQPPPPVEKPIEGNSWLSTMSAAEDVCWMDQRNSSLAHHSTSQVIQNRLLKNAFLRRIVPELYFDMIFADIETSGENECIA